MNSSLLCWLRLSLFSECLLVSLSVSPYLQPSPRCSFFFSFPCAEEKNVQPFIFVNYLSGFDFRGWLYSLFLPLFVFVFVFTVSRSLFFDFGHTQTHTQNPFPARASSNTRRCLCLSFTRSLPASRPCVCVRRCFFFFLSALQKKKSKKKTRLSCTISDFTKEATGVTLCHLWWCAHLPDDV